MSDPFFQAGLQADVLATLESAGFKQMPNPDLAKYRAAFEMGKENLKTLAEAGVSIGFGTDAGPPLRFQGYFEHPETLRRLARRQTRQADWGPVSASLLDPDVPRYRTHLQPEAAVSHPSVEISLAESSLDGHFAGSLDVP